MFFGKNSEVVDSTCNKLIFKNQVIEFVGQFTYLGVTLDKDLKFDTHINRLVSSCNQKLHTLSKIRKFISEDVSIRIYKSLIMSVKDYGDVFYDCAPKTLVDKLQKVQNRALRISNLATRFTSNLDLH